MKNIFFVLFVISMFLTVLSCTPQHVQDDRADDTKEDCCGNGGNIPPPVEP